MSRGSNFNFLVFVCVIFLKIIAKSEGTIKCYKCLAALPQYYTNETIRLCKDFDYSDKFIVDCPYSTFCVKRFTSAKIPNVINGTERDCANQKQIIQKYHNGSWHQEVEIEEPYTPGCQLINDKGARTSTIENCYCNYDMCNATNKLGYSFSGILIIAVIIYVL